MNEPELKVNVEVGALNRALALYLDLTGKTPEDVVLKQGGKLGYAVAQRLRGLAPAKGEVRSERLAALKAGGGIRIRPRIRARILQQYGARIDLKSRALVFGNSKRGRQSFSRGSKRLNIQALMVRAELNARESGRGFLGVSARYPKILQRQQLARSKYGPVLSEAGLNASSDTLTFEWDASKSELSANAVTGLTKAQAQAAIALGIRDTTDDIKLYLSQKLLDNARKAGLS